MRKFGYVLGCLLGASTFVTALPGYADIPPVDYCNVEGSSCHNAGGIEQAGICKAAQCSRHLPDGSSMTYDCFHCVALGSEGGASSGGDGGMGGEVTLPPATGGVASATGGVVGTTGGAASATGGVASATGGVAGASGEPNKDHGGCSLSPFATERGLAGLMTALGLSALFFARRRS